MKYIGINLTKEVKGPYTGNYKKLSNEIAENQEMERYSVLMDWKN